MFYRSLMLNLDDGLHCLLQKPWYPLALCIVLLFLPLTRDAMLWLGLSMPITLGLVYLSSFLGPWPTLGTFGLCAVVMAVGCIANLHF
jgi:hypothetical protein